MNAVMNTEQIRNALGISRSTLYRLLHTEGFPVIHIGRRMVTTEQALHDWLQAGGSAKIPTTTHR